MCVWSSLWSVCPLCSLCLVKSLCPLCSLCLVRSVCPQCFLCLVRFVCPLCPLVWWDPCVHCVLVFGEILVSNVFVVFGEIRVSNVFFVFGEMLLRVSTVFLVHSGHTNLTKNKKYSGLTDLTKHKEHSGHMDFNKYKEYSGQIDHKELHTHMISQGTKGILLIITQRTLQYIISTTPAYLRILICNEPTSTAELTRVHSKRACASPIRYEPGLN